ASPRPRPKTGKPDAPSAAANSSAFDSAANEPADTLKLAPVSTVAGRLAGPYFATRTSAHIITTIATHSQNTLRQWRNKRTGSGIRDRGCVLTTPSDVGEAATGRGDRPSRSHSVRAVPPAARRRNARATPSPCATAAGATPCARRIRPGR